MAAEPFNSAGGYTYSIPPQPFITANGNLSAVNATFTNVSISGNLVTSGTISADNFVGNVQGNIIGDFAVVGPNTGIVYNKAGIIFSDDNFKFDYANAVLNLNGNLVTNSITMGVGPLEFSKAIVFNATTNSSTPEQPLHTIAASTVSSIDYVVVATDATANTRQTSKLIAGVLGDTVEYFEYGTIDINGGVCDVRIKNETGNVILTVSPMTSNQITYKIMVTTVKEG